MKPDIITAIIITITISPLYASPTTPPSTSPSTSPTTSPTTIPIASPTASPTFSLDSYPTILEIETSNLTTYYWYHGENYNGRRVYRSATKWYIYYDTTWGINRWTVSNEGILDGDGENCARDNLYECYERIIVRYCVNGSESVTDVYTVRPPWTGFYYNGRWRLQATNLDDKFIYYHNGIWKVTDKNLYVIYAICDKDNIFDCNREEDGFEFSNCYKEESTSLPTIETTIITTTNNTTTNVTYEESINLSIPQTTIFMTGINITTNIAYEDGQKSYLLYVIIGLVIMISCVGGCIIGYKYRTWTTTKKMMDDTIKISIKMTDVANNANVANNIQMHGKINCDQRMMKPIPINTGIKFGEKTVSDSNEELYDDREIDNNQQDVDTSTPNVIPGDDTPSCEQPGCGKDQIEEYRNVKDTSKNSEERSYGDV